MTSHICMFGRTYQSFVFLFVCFLFGRPVASDPEGDWQKQRYLEHTSQPVSCVTLSSLEPREAPESPPLGGVCNDQALSVSLPRPTCQRKAADDPLLLTDGGMEIITNVSCGIGHKLIHTKYCTSGLSLLFFFLIRCRQMKASSRN